MARPSGSEWPRIAADQEAWAGQVRLTRFKVGLAAAKDAVNTKLQQKGNTKVCAGWGAPLAPGWPAPALMRRHWDGKLGLHMAWSPMADRRTPWWLLNLYHKA